MKFFLAWDNPFLFLGLLWAAFFGWRAVHIFIDEQAYEKKKWDWWTYQVLFNALGAFMGWVALWAVWDFGFPLATVHFVLGLIAFLGITGNLPYAVMLGKLK